MTDHLSSAHQLLASGVLYEARIYLDGLLRQDRENTDLLYNLGLCYVDLGQLDKGRELRREMKAAVQQHSHACVALAQQVAGRLVAPDLLQHVGAPALGKLDLQDRRPLSRLAPGLQLGCWLLNGELPVRAASYVKENSH